MKPRTLTILSFLVLALAAVVVLDRPRAPRVDEGRDRIFPELAAAEVARLTLDAPGRAQVVLVREGDALALEQPGRHPTDAAQVRELVSTLEYLAFRRRLPAGSAAEDEARGLASPRRTITVSLAGGATLELRVGKREPALGRVWMRRADRAEAYLVDDYFDAALDRGADDLRRRDPLAVVAGGDAPLEVQVGGARLALRGRPRCVELAGGCARADAGRVADLEGRLGALRVTRFVPGAALAEGDVKARVRAGGAELRVGGDCPGAPGERLVDSALGPACVRGDVVDALAAAAADPASWVERALLDAGPRAVRRVDIAAGGDARLALERQGGEWALLDAAGARTPVDDEAMRAWLEELASYRGERLAEGAAAPPLAELTLATDDGGEWRLQLEPSEVQDRVRVRRAGEPVALQLHADVARFFVPDSVQFHDRTVLRFEPFALQAIELAGTGGAEKVVRGETTEEWRVVEPLEVDADLPTVAALRDLASELRAERPLAAAAAPEHGLAPPRRTLTFVVDAPHDPAAPPARHVLELGARLDGGRCVVRRGGDPTVFTLDAESCALLDVHLATRRVLPDAEPVAVTVGTARFERHGPAWYDAAGGTRLDDARAAALAELLARLRDAPEVVAYGPLPRPRARVVVETATGATTLLVASPEYALEGRAVRYRLPTEACAAWPLLCR